MKICVLNDNYIGSESIFSKVDIIADPTPYLVGHQVTQVFLEKKTAIQQVEMLVDQGYDLFINLCDGSTDEDRPGIEVVLTLEKMGAAFTGADSKFYNPTRLQMKQACIREGILTPKYEFIFSLKDIFGQCRSLQFPLIVKHPNSYGSIGLTRASKVYSWESLNIQVDEMIRQFGAALVEEFITGKEFSVLVAENPDDAFHPFTFKPIEIQFSGEDTFKHFDMKWINFGDIHTTPCSDPALERQLRNLSERFFLALGGVSYGRCDLRVDEHGNAYMLEINPNCGIFYPPSDPGMADEILLKDPLGYPVFMDLILQAALKRQLKRRNG